jgi:hypothetical protein
VFGLFPEFRPYVTAERLRPFVARLRTFQKADAVRVVAEVPPEWDVRDELRDRIAEFLHQRSQIVAERIARFADELEATQAFRARALRWFVGAAAKS